MGVPQQMDVYGVFQEGMRDGDEGRGYQDGRQKGATLCVCVCVFVPWFETKNEHCRLCKASSLLSFVRV